jgi:two-component system chemotaxis response regulator CheY
MAYKVLIVDDSQPMRSVIKKTIKASGFGGAEFFEAANGQEALSILKSQWLDIVVTDYNMPEMNGVELIAEMKKDEMIRTIPVLMITTEGSRSKIDEFIQLGAAGYIKKPFTPEAIKAKLTEILGGSHDDKGVEESDNSLDF